MEHVQDILIANSPFMVPTLPYICVCNAALLTLTYILPSYYITHTQTHTHGGYCMCVLVCGFEFLGVVCELLLVKCRQG